MNAKAMTKRIHPACQDFVAVVEELLVQRQQEATLAGRPDSPWQDDDWALRTWTRTELEYMVYSSYKQMRNGRITRRLREPGNFHGDRLALFAKPVTTAGHFVL